MSVLDDFARMRAYRTRASELDLLAETEPLAEARLRYRIIARHYRELADREERSDKARMAERLEQLRRRRQETAAPVPRGDNRRPGSANDNLPIGLLRLMQIIERARHRRRELEEKPQRSLPGV
jgi:hypothetical protein